MNLNLKKEIKNYNQLKLAWKMRRNKKQNLLKKKCKILKKKFKKKNKDN